MDAGFEFMQKMGIEYDCFHDVDLCEDCLLYTSASSFRDTIFSVRSVVMIFIKLLMCTVAFRVSVASTLYPEMIPVKLSLIHISRI